MALFDFASHLRQAFPTSQRQRAARRNKPRPLALEMLEDRLTPSTVTSIAFSTSPQTLSAGAVSGPLTVHVTDAGSPVSGEQIDLTSNSTGAATFYSDSTGMTAVTNIDTNGSGDATFYYKDTAAGTPTVKAADDATPSVFATQQETVNPAEVSGSFLPLAATEGAPVSGTVFAFTDANPAAQTAGYYTATVALGDGHVVMLTSTASADGQIVYDNTLKQFDVNLTHTYLEELSDQTFSVSVANTGGQSASDSTKHFTVADAALTAGVLTPPTPTEGQALTNVAVFHFTDADPNATASDYTATITWGDGTISTVTGAASADGQIVSSNGGFDVLGSHTYLEEAAGRPFSVSVTDHSAYFNGFETAASLNDVTDSTTNVDGASISRETSGAGLLPSAPASGNYFGVAQNTDNAYETGYGQSIYTTYGGDQETYTGTFQQSVAIYINTAWAAPAATYAPAFWLDMAPDHQDPNNFGAEHNFRFWVDGNGTVKVTADGDVESNAFTTITTSGWYTFQMVFYKAANPTDPALTDLHVYNATNALLGSKTGLPATSPGGPFPSSDLTGHGYAWLTVWQNGFANDQLAIDNLSTSVLPISAAGSVSVADAALSSTSAALTPPSATENQPFTDAVLFRFTDANPNASASDFTATVQWGDGNSNSSTDGSGDVTVVQTGNGFEVVGSHTYSMAVSHGTFSVSVADVGGATTAQSTAIAVNSYPTDAVVDFPGSGVYVYRPGGGFQQIDTADASLLAINANGDVVADFQGSGFYEYTESTQSWSHLDTLDASVLAINANGDVVADISGDGVFLYSGSTQTWRQVDTINASLLAIDAAGDVFGEFSGAGVWEMKAGGPFLQIDTANASLLAVGANGDLFADLAGAGVYEYTAGAWQQIDTVNASLLAADAKGDLFADLGGDGVYEYTAGAWQQIDTVNASLLAADAKGDLFADLGGDGVYEYTAGAWQQIDTVNASVLA